MIYVPAAKLIVNELPAGKVEPTLAPPAASSLRKMGEPAAVKRYRRVSRVFPFPTVVAEKIPGLARVM
jgi:hypothetical protein